MPEYTGPIQALELARWLWLLPFFPLLGAVLQAVYASGLFEEAFDAVVRGYTEDAEVRAPSRRTPASPATVARIALATLGASLATAVAYTVALVERAPNERLLLGHVWQMVRAGPVDVGLDLAFDPLSATLAVTVTLVGTVVAAASLPGEPGWRFFAWLEAFVFFVVVALLADNLLLLLFAWEGAALAGYGLAHVAARKGAADDGTGMRTFVPQRAGDAALILGAALLFWGMGGTWGDDGGFQSDLDPRIAAVAVTATDEPPAPGYAVTQGTGYLTVTGISDALVYADDSRTPLLGPSGLPLRSPFRRHEMKGGAHSFRVAPDDDFRLTDKNGKGGFMVEGGVLPNYMVPKQPMGGDHELALTVIGPTLRFRELRDELVLSDVKGAHALRTGLMNRPLQGGAGGAQAPKGAHLVTVVCLLLVLGALLKGWLPGALSATPPAAAVVHVAGLGVLSVYFVARIGFLVALSPVASAVLAIVGASAAVYGAFAAIQQYEILRLLSHVGLSQVGLAFLALGASAYVSAAFEITLTAALLTTLLICAGAAARTGRGDLRFVGGLGASMPRTATAYRLGAVGLALAPAPLLGGFWPTSAVLTNTFSSTAIPPWLGKPLFVAGLVAVTLTSFAVWRSYYLLFTGRSAKEDGKKRRDPPAARLATSLGVASLAAGLVLGVSSREIGGTADSGIHRWLAPVFSAFGARFEGLDVVPRLGLLVLMLVLAYVGWWTARSRYGDGRPDDWEARESSLPGHGLGESLR